MLREVVRGTDGEGTMMSMREKAIVAMRNAYAATDAADSSAWDQIFDAALGALMGPPNEAFLPMLEAFIESVESRLPQLTDSASPFERGLLTGQRLHSGIELKAAWQAMLHAIKEGK